jgi:heme exporter protein D
MIWNSAADFFAMGGYAFYVWGSFVVTAVALAVEIAGLRRRRRAAIADLRRERSARQVSKVSVPSR